MRNPRVGDRVFANCEYPGLGVVLNVQDGSKIIVVKKDDGALLFTVEEKLRCVRRAPKK